MNNHINKFIKLFLAAGLVHISGLAYAGEINTGYFGNVAIKGYDPVAYFTEQRAVKGKDGIAHSWLGAEWQFSSDKHKKMFSENPVKYAPQYGGFCADGVAYEETTSNIDPQAWRIIDGKLYLNFSEGAAVELEEVEGQLEKAEKKWPEIREKILETSY